MFFKTPWEDVRLPRGAKFNSRIEDRWRSFSLEEEEEEEKRSLLERSYEKSFYPKDREVSFRSWNGKEILLEIQKFRYYISISTS